VLDQFHLVALKSLDRFSPCFHWLRTPAPRSELLQAAPPQALEQNVNFLCANAELLEIHDSPKVPDNFSLVKGCTAS
jgi:hypothetical protein